MSAARIALAVAVITALAFFVVGGLLRIWLPFPLNDVELAIVAHVRRVSNGLALYAAPDVHFVPLVYTPLFYYASALAARFVGDGFVAPRLVSFLASLISIWCAYRFVRLESGSRDAGLVAAGLYAALGADIGWLALARVDALMGCLALAGLYRLRAARRHAGLVAAGILLGLAVLTKQSALVMCVPVLLWETWSDRARGLWLLTGFTGTVILLGGFWEWQSGGWFSYYTVYVAAHQSVGNALGTAQVGSTELMRLVPFAVLAPVLLLVKSLRARLGIAPATARFYLVVAVAAYAASLASELLHSSLSNVLLPTCAWLLILFAICGERIARLARREADAGWTLLLASVCLAQFLALAYAPSKLIPGMDDPVTTGTPLIAISGDVRAAGAVRTWLQASALSDVEYADGFAVQDLRNGAGPDIARRFEQRVRDAVCRATPERPVVLDAAVAALDGPAPLSPAWVCGNPPHQVQSE